MCGIVGLVGFEETGAGLAQARAALDTLVHRGPDDAGLLVYAPSRGERFLLDERGNREPWPAELGAQCTDVSVGDVTLGLRRLAIIDLSQTGHQPMVTSDGRYAIVFNGEIYNHLELREVLRALGHQFRGRSDTEVLLASYAEWGRECFHRLVGMFAFGVLDTARGRLVLARDHFGMKPLYYTQLGSRFAFASEIRALLALKGVRRRASSQRVFDFLQEGITDDGPDTLFAAIRSLPAAHTLEISLSGSRIAAPAPYWHGGIPEPLDTSFEDAARRVRDVFLHSIELHLRSDVPVGAMLSGGVDSSSIAMAIRHVGGSDPEIHTFSYIGGDGAPSEEPWIDVVNSACSAVAHKVALEPEHWWEGIESVVEAQGEPFGSLAIYAQNRLYREAAAHGIKVMLGGQGGDETFGGYEHHVHARLASLVRQGSLRGVASLLRGASADGSTGVLSPAVRGAFRALPRTVREALRASRGVRPWISPPWCTKQDVRLGRAEANGGRSVLRNGLQHNLRRNLPILLRYEDRNSMAHSIEGRLPFLTRESAELALALPEDHLVDRRAVGKAVFREAMRGIVPDTVLDRRDRTGFAVPVHTWPSKIPGLRRVLDDAWAIPALSRAWIQRAGSAVESGAPLSVQRSYALWRVIGFVMWARRFDVTFD